MADRRTRHNEAGFTLIEVMVAIGILGLVMLALIPQVVAGLRSAGVARDVTQTKGLAAAQLEQMRGMPFYVGREAGDYVDVLDTYYRNLTAPTSTPSCASTLSQLPPSGWTGYVAAGSTARCSWEPATGAFYRRVITPITAPGLGAFSMVVSTQFLTGTTPPIPVTPPAGYTSQTAGSDQPPAAQVGVTVAVLSRSHNGVRNTTVYSQVERSTAMTPTISSRAQATTVHVSSATRNWTDWDPGAEDPQEMSYDQPTVMANLGVLDLKGELYTGSRVVAHAVGGHGSTSLPTSIEGAALHLDAPADSTNQSSVAGDQFLPNGCRWFCLGATTADQGTFTTADGLPQAGSSSQPVRAMIRAGAGRSGFWFDNGKWRNRMRLQSGAPMVSLDTTETASQGGSVGCVVGATGAVPLSAHLGASGYLAATPVASNNRAVESCAIAQANTVRLFLTDFAPNGVVRIKLTRASAHCVARPTASPTATADYAATVQYWNGSGYTTAGTIRPSNNADPLDAVNLNQVIHSSSGLTLGDYIASWGSLTANGIKRTASPGSTSVDLPGVVTVVTAPTRRFAFGWGPTNADDSSAISVAVGSVGCTAKDSR